MPIKKTTEKFIEEAIAVHGFLYDYSKVSYINAETKVCIGCRVHGEFIQLPIIHTRGGGCKLCANDNLKKPGLTNKDFISKAVALHGAIYDYDLASGKAHGARRLPPSVFSRGMKASLPPKLSINII
jgi:hypothetical protein